MEGTMYQVGKIKEKTSQKQEKYDSPTGRQNYEVTHMISIALDLLRGYQVKLEIHLTELTRNKKRTDYLIKKTSKMDCHRTMKLL